MAHERIEWLIEAEMAQGAARGESVTHCVHEDV